MRATLADVINNKDSQFVTFINGVRVYFVLDEEDGVTYTPYAEVEDYEAGQDNSYPSFVIGDVKVGNGHAFPYYERDGYHHSIVAYQHVIIDID